MNRSTKKAFFISALASLVCVTVPVALADSLVTTDGDVLIGAVTKTPSGYTVQTADGSVDIANDKVKRVLYDHPHPAPPQPTVPTPGVAPIPASSAGKKPVDAREITALTQQGEAAMAAGEFPDARDAFTDLLSLDKSNALAGKGLGYAYLKMEKPQKALKPLELAAMTQQPDRSLTIGLAASLVASHNPMRAAKYVKIYLEAHPAPLDEPMINTLGIALSQADSAATRSTLFLDGVKLYNRFNADLEAGQTGKKRWGIEWQDADEVARKQKLRQDAQKKVDDAWGKLQTANAQLQSAQNNLSQVSNSSMRASSKRDAVDAAQNKVNSAQTAADKAQADYDDANKAIADVPGPSFPNTVALEDVNLSLTPDGALASATPQPAATPGMVATPPTRTDPTVPPVVASAPPTDPDPVETKPAATPTPTPTPTPGPTPQVNKPNPTPSAKPAPSPANTAHVTRYAVAFAIAPDTLVTAASTVEGATDVVITTADGKNIQAEVLRTLHGEGLALLKITGASLQCLPLATVPSGGSLTCLGFPDVELFNPVAKQMTATATDQTDSWTVALGTPPRVPGGPIMKAGAVVGVELGDRDSDPSQVSSATLKSLLSLVQDAAHPAPAASDARLAIVMVKAER